MTKTNKKGFTLVELLAVIIILAVLILIALPNVMKITDTAKKKAFINEAFVFIDAAEKQYIADGETNVQVYTYDTTNGKNNIKSIFLKRNGQSVDTKQLNIKFKNNYKAFVIIKPGKNPIIWLKNNNYYINELNNNIDISTAIQNINSSDDNKCKCSNLSSKNCSIDNLNTNNEGYLSQDLYAFYTGGITWPTDWPW